MTKGQISFVDKEMDNRYSVRTLMKMIDAEKQAVIGFRREAWWRRLS